VHTTFVSGVSGRGAIGNYTSRLEIGVSVFFVISGFLLYRPFAVSHFDHSERPAVPSFWVRRLKRIIPAYWLAFIVVTYVLHADQIRHGFAALAVYLGFAQIYSPTYALGGISQAWSLCTEMTFYLALPLWALLIGRKRRDPASQMKVELAGLAALFASSVVFRVFVLRAQAHSILALTMPNWLPAYTDLFALGMLLAVVSAWSQATGRQPRLLWHRALPWVSWSLAGVAFVTVSNIGLPVTPLTGSPVGLSLARQTLYGLFALFVVLPAVVGVQESGVIRRILTFKPLALIGVVSYGVYLWHEAWINLFLRWTGDKLFTAPFWPLIAFAGGLATLSATASYVLVERPILRSKHLVPMSVRRHLSRLGGRPLAARGPVAVPGDTASVPPLPTMAGHS
jgi:peptidoglycan/LPS O-acetylase OafA/YrhL